MGFYANAEIPKNCMQCEWRDAEACNQCELMIDNPFPSLTEQYRHCPFQMIAKRHVLIPVGQHGRLKDADVLAGEIWKARSHYQMMDDSQTADKIMEGLYHAERILKEIPTIIPASKEGKFRDKHPVKEGRE